MKLDIHNIRHLGSEGILSFLSVSVLFPVASGKRMSTNELSLIAFSNLVVLVGTSKLLSYYVSMLSHKSN